MQGSGWLTRAYNLKMRLSLDDCGRRLAQVHASLSLDEARVLLMDAYRRFRAQERYGGNLVQTLMGIEVSVLSRATDHELQQRLAMAREWF